MSNAKRFDYKRIRERREALGLTQQQLADRAGMDRFKVLRYENGRARPHPDALARLAGALGRTPNYFYVDPGATSGTRGAS